MDYEKKYKEALERAKGIIEQNPLMEYLKKGIEYILPELKESEDERMWKLIKKYAHYNISDLALEADHITREQLETWLEKQHIQKQETSYPKFDFDDILALQCCMETAEKVTEDKELYEKLKSLHSRLHDVYWLEKQGEQKQDPCNDCKDVMLNCHNFPCVKKKEFKQGKSVLEVINEEKVDNANKVEHKFNEGDWVVNRENKIGQIKALKKDKYNELRYCIEWKNGKKTNPIQYYTDNYCHLWTLSNVKNGDILYSPSHHLIWIYRDNEHYYACVNMNYVTENVAIDGLINIPNDACPATKEQRNQLKKAMRKTIEEIKRRIKLCYI